MVMVTDARPPSSVVSTIAGSIGARAEFYVARAHHRGSRQGSRVAERSDDSATVTWSPGV